MRLVAAELLKVWTAPRVLLGILLSELAIVLIGTIATLHSAVNDPVLPQHLSRDIATMEGIALLFTTLVGVLIATTEYRHGTITLTFLATPVREKVLAAKSGAAVIASVLLTLPAALLPILIAEIWVGGRADYYFGGHEWQLVARLFLGAALVAMIGFFIGASLKRQLGAVILVLAWIIFLEPALGGLFPGTKDYLIGPNLGGVLGDSGTDVPSFGHSFAVPPPIWSGSALSRSFSRGGATSRSERAGHDDVRRGGPVAEARVHASHAGVRLVVRREDLLDARGARTRDLLALEAVAIPRLRQGRRTAVSMFSATGEDRAAPP